MDKRQPGTYRSGPVRHRGRAVGSRKDPVSRREREGEEDVRRRGQVERERERGREIQRGS